MPVSPPPKRLPAPNALDIELREMSIAVERGFPRFPPPPPPLDAKAAALARAQTRPLVKRRELDGIEILVRVLLALLAVALLLGAWAFWRSLFS